MMYVNGIRQADHPIIRQTTRQLGEVIGAESKTGRGTTRPPTPRGSILLEWRLCKSDWYWSLSIDW